MRLAAIAILSVIALFALLTGPRAKGEAPSPSPTPYTSTTSTPSTAVVRSYCMRVYRRAVVLRRRYAKAKRCFGAKPLIVVAAHPGRSDSDCVWLARRAQWAAQCREMSMLTKRMVARMRHPGGTPSGARWIPLARWVGWPDAQIGTLVYIMAKRGGSGESGGRPGAHNPVIDCTGLMQIWPGNLTYLHISWHAKIAWLKNPENNLRAALRLWRKCGWEKWAL